MPSKNSAIASAPIPPTKNQSGNNLVWNVADGYVQLARRTDKDDDLQKPVVGKPPHDQPDNDLIAAPDNRAPLAKLGDPPAETKQVAPFQSTWSFAEAVTPSLVSTYFFR